MLGVTETCSEREREGEREREREKLREVLLLFVLKTLPREGRLLKNVRGFTFTEKPEISFQGFIALSTCTRNKIKR